MFDPHKNLWVRYCPSPIWKPLAFILLQLYRFGIQEELSGVHLYACGPPGMARVGVPLLGGFHAHVTVLLGLSRSPCGISFRPFPCGLGFTQHAHLRPVTLPTWWLASKRWEVEVPGQWKFIPGTGTVSLLLFSIGQSHHRVCPSSRV